jgi:hypothetical protein
MRGFGWVVGCGVVLLPAWAFASVANDFPTMARVDHVLTCMREQGGQSLDNLYSCTCEIDAIAEQMPFSDFEDATTFAAMRNMPGERGGIYRQSELGEKLVNQLKDVKLKAHAKCFLRPKAAVVQPTGPGGKDKRKE